MFREGFLLGLEVNRHRQQPSPTPSPTPARVSPPQSSGTTPAGPATAALEDACKSLEELIKEPWCDVRHG